MGENLSTAFQDSIEFRAWDCREESLYPRGGNLLLLSCANQGFAAEDLDLLAFDSEWRGMMGVRSRRSDAAEDRLHQRRADCSGRQADSLTGRIFPATAALTLSESLAGGHLYF